MQNLQKKSSLLADCANGSNYPIQVVDVFVCVTDVHVLRLKV